uniref:Glutathione S-transferase theta 2 n=1 Tax=Sinocyclocheilus anshuiensis TaxID=1608454 RepID=A0A671LQ09_9TELE
MAGRQAVKAYLDLVSQACRAVLIFLKHNKIPHTVENIAIRKGQHKTPEFTKLNPMQKLPVLEDNGFVLTESDAILKYLCAVLCTTGPPYVPDHWYPKLPEKRARVDEYTAWNHANTHTSSIFLHEIGFDMWLVDMTFQAVTLFFFQNCFLCQLKSFKILSRLFQSLCGGRDILKDRPKLLSWRSRVQSVLSDSFDEAHSAVYQIRDKFTAKLSPCSKQATL